MKTNNYQTTQEKIDKIIKGIKDRLKLAKCFDKTDVQTARMCRCAAEAHKNCLKVLFPDLKIPEEKQ
jgi:hypothetical protein